MICIKYPSYGRESYRITKHWVLSPELEAYVLGETDSIPGNTGLGWVILAKTAREMLRDGRLKTGWQGRHLYYPEAPNPPDQLLAYRDRSWWTRLKENLGW